MFQGISRWARTFSSLGHDKDAEDGDQRLEGMAIAQDRVHAVVDRRVKQDQPEQQPGARPALAQSAAESPEHQNRRGQKQRVLRRPAPFWFGGLRRSRPETDEAFEA